MLKEVKKRCVWSRVKSQRGDRQREGECSAVSVCCGDGSAAGRRRDAELAAEPKL